MNRTAARALALLAAFVLAACDGEEGDPMPSGSATVSPTVNASATPAVATTSSPAPTATPTREPQVVLQTLWLVDVESSGVLVLHETPGWITWEGFEPDGSVLFVTQGGRHRAALDGSPLEAGDPRCRSEGADAVIDGRTFSGAGCGDVSPDGRFMVYETSPGPDRRYGYGIVDLETHEDVRLRDDLVHCGGCDARYGPAWSPSGGYVVIAESGGDGRIFLAEAEAGTDRVLGRGNEVTRQPAWSPAADILALAGANGTALVHPRTGEEWPIDLAWPVRWDSTGRYLYAPAWGAGGVTRVFDMESGGTDQLPGTPPQVHLWSHATAVVGLEGGGYTAALEGASGCAGVRVVSALAPDASCVEGGLGAAISPDGRTVAVPVDTGESVSVDRSTTRWPRTMSRLRLVLLDVAAGDVREVAGDMVGYPGEPPAVQWHPDGAHLLVRWPAGWGI